jgi:hypothetical protein
MNMRYSFQQHFGSSLTGTQSYRRKEHLSSHFKDIWKGVTDVKSHERRGGSVSAMRKNIKYGAHNHISH